MIGFAVPVDTVNRVVTQVLRYGRVVRPGLGVRAADDRTASRLGLSGVLLIGTNPGTTVADAGLQGTRRDAQKELILGDIIVAVGEAQIGSIDDLTHILETYKVGDTGMVTIIRGGQRLERIGNAPSLAVG